MTIPPQAASASSAASPAPAAAGASSSRPGSPASEAPAAPAGGDLVIPLPSDPAAPGPAGPPVAMGEPAEPVAVTLGPRARLFPALGAVYRAQLSRARVARMPLMFVATFQSVGIMIMMRGVVSGGDDEAARSVVAGSSVLVVAFVALNLLAQYFGRLRASGGLDHYATLPVPPASVVLGAAGAYASFAIPGTLFTAALGAELFRLPWAHLWVLVGVTPLVGAALSGLGATCGLLAARQELATLLGQLGMSAALLLGVLPPTHMPEPVRLLRDLLPSTYGVEALARSFDVVPDWAAVTGDLAVCAGVGLVSLVVATWAYRRAATR